MNREMKHILALGVSAGLIAIVAEHFIKPGTFKAFGGK